MLDETASTLSELGGDVTSLDSTTDKALGTASERLADEVRAATAFDGAGLVDRAEAASEKWEHLLVDEVGIPADVPLLEIAEWLDGHDIDYQAYADLMFDEFLIEHRPGS